jgi:hypothetical protein
LAQPEQWLEYHTSSTAMGYRYQDISTNAPAGVALPTLNGPAVFARWTTPMDPAGGRWMCLDGKRKTGPRDRLFLDSNGNGRLDDETPIAANRTDQYYAYFDSVRVTFKGEDGPITYHLMLRYMSYEGSRTYLLASSGGFYEGMINLGGKKQQIRLIDGNVNGTFNDLSLNPSDADRVVLGGNKADEDVEIGQKYLGRLLEVGKDLYQIEVARDGAFVKVKKAENVPLGQVRVPPTISNCTVLGEMGEFSRKPSAGEFTLPVGKYRLYTWDMTRKDDKGVNWQLSGRGASEASNFEVKSDLPTILAVGEPIRAGLQVVDLTNTISFQLRMQGQYGESIEITRNGQRPRAPQLQLANRDGSIRYTNTFEYG